jgi:sugar phosphate isomerase/epimerase
MSAWIRPDGVRVVLHHQGAAEIAIRHAAKVGIPCVMLDLAAVANQGLLDDASRRSSLAAALDRHSLRGVVHGDFRQPLAATSAIARQRAVDAAARELELAVALGAPLIIHPSQEPGGARARWHALECFAQTVTRLVTLAGSSSSVLVENLPDEPPGSSHESPLVTGDEIAALLEMCPGAELAFDIGHANIRQADPVELFGRLAARIRCLLLNDNQGDRDSHLLPGHGNVDFGRLVGLAVRLRWHGDVVVEVRPGAALHQHRAAWQRIRSGVAESDRKDQGSGGMA